MSHEVRMPRLSETADEGIVVAWFVAPGAAVREGDLIAEVQVEKISSEVRAEASGRIGQLRAEPGGVVAQGGVLTVIEAAGAASATGGVAAPAPAAAAQGGEAAGSAGQGGGTFGGPASPAAKRLARELGVDIAAIGGTGPGGRIVEADIRAAAGGGAAVPSGGRSAPPEGRSAVAAVEPLTPMRRAIADRLQAGLAGTAQLTVTAEADVTDLANRIGELRARWARPVSYTEVAVRASALALREHPRLAMRWTDRGLAPAHTMDIGIAVALDDGLIVPVVRDADRKRLEAIGIEVADLAARARAGRLEAADTEGGVFSVTNLGGYGIDAFTPLLNPPQTAILGLGRARARPAVVDGQIVPRMLMVLSLTFDHRVVDGAPAAGFLATLVGLLQSPEAIIEG